MRARSELRRVHGFTLIEIALAVALLALVFGAILPPIAARVEQAQYRAVDRSLHGVRLALTGFAQSYGRLPCPDHDGDGLEEPGCSSSGSAGRPSTRGRLPFAALGLPPADRWGRLYSYAVAEAFTRAAVHGAGCGAHGLDLCDDGTLTVRTRGDDPRTPDTVEQKSLVTVATRAPAVIVSHGRNGAGALAAARPGAPAAPVRPATDEAENADGDGVFVQRARTRTASRACSDDTEAAAACPFDDVVVWLSSRVLLHRLVDAGHLP